MGGGICRANTLTGECEEGRIGRKSMVQLPETLSISTGSYGAKMVHGEGLRWAEMAGPSCACALSLAGTECCGGCTGSAPGCWQPCAFPAAGSTLRGELSGSVHVWCYINHDRTYGLGESRTLRT